MDTRHLVCLFVRWMCLCVCFDRMHIRSLGIASTCLSTYFGKYICSRGLFFSMLVLSYTHTRCDALIGEETYDYNLHHSCR